MVAARQVDKPDILQSHYKCLSITAHKSGDPFYECQQQLILHQKTAVRAKGPTQETIRLASVITGPKVKGLGSRERPPRLQCSVVLLVLLFVLVLLLIVTSPFPFATCTSVRFKTGLESQLTCTSVKLNPKHPLTPSLHPPVSARVYSVHSPNVFRCNLTKDTQPFAFERYLFRQVSRRPLRNLRSPAPSRRRNHLDLLPHQTGPAQVRNHSSFSSPNQPSCHVSYHAANFAHYKAP